MARNKLQWHNAAPKRPHRTHLLAGTTGAMHPSTNDYNDNHASAHDDISANDECQQQ